MRTCVLSERARLRSYGFWKASLKISTCFATSSMISDEEEAAHLERLVEEKKRARHHRGLGRLAKAAPSSQAFLRVVAEQGVNLGSTTARLLQLLDAVGPDELEEALVEALERDTVHVGAVRQITDRRRSQRGLPPPVSIPITRGEHSDLVVTPHPLSTYDTLKKEDKT
jgi:hypothetical protein